MESKIMSKTHWTHTHMHTHMHTEMQVVKSAEIIVNLFWGLGNPTSQSKSFFRRKVNKNNFTEIEQNFASSEIEKKWLQLIRNTRQQGRPTFVSLDCLIVYVCSYLQASIYIYICTHTHTCSCIYTHIYPHILLLWVLCLSASLSWPNGKPMITVLFGITKEIIKIFIE